MLSEKEQEYLKAFLAQAELAEMTQAADLIKNCDITFQMAKTHSVYVKDWEKTKEQMEDRLESNLLPPGISALLFQAMIDGSEKLVQEKLAMIRTAFQLKFGESIYNYLDKDGKTKKLFGIFG